MRTDAFDSVELHQGPRSPNVLLRDERNVKLIDLGPTRLLRFPRFALKVTLELLKDVLWGVHIATLREDDLALLCTWRLEANADVAQISFDRAADSIPWTFAVAWGPKVPRDGLYPCPFAHVFTEEHGEPLDGLRRLEVLRCRSAAGASQ
ncbi:MAG: hypothetical protein VYE42_02610 [Actinomycetota bacterium]|nr:hypothetical protein [Actinomycetota bacterium]